MRWAEEVVYIGRKRAEESRNGNRGDCHFKVTFLIGLTQRALPCRATTGPFGGLAITSFSPFLGKPNKLVRVWWGSFSVTPTLVCSSWDILNPWLSIILFNSRLSIWIDRSEKQTFVFGCFIQPDFSKRQLSHLRCCVCQWFLFILSLKFYF